MSLGILAAFLLLLGAELLAAAALVPRGRRTLLCLLQLVLTCLGRGNLCESPTDYPRVLECAGAACMLGLAGQASHWGHIPQGARAAQPRATRGL